MPDPARGLAAELAMVPKSAPGRNRDHAIGPALRLDYLDLRQTVLRDGPGSATPLSRGSGQSWRPVELSTFHLQPAADTAHARPWAPIRQHDAR
jgi:hypothetical protein